MAKNPISVLVLGASYGLLPAVRIALAGHIVTVVCRSDEGRNIAASGAVLTMPERGGGARFDLKAAAHQGQGTPNSIGFVTPEEARPDNADFVLLAMQEPQLKTPEIRSLMHDVARTHVPVLSLQNMPPPPYLKRIGLDAALIAGAYSDMSVWQGFDPDLFSMASPDAQAMRPDPKNPGALKITLATNFKAAPFSNPDAQRLLEQLSADVDASRPLGRHSSVRLVASQHLHAPLAKWPMLISGNCRCLRDGNAPVSIAAAVHTDIDASRQIYDWTANLAQKVGAPDAALVTFDRYAEAAKALSLPSSLARGLAAGAKAAERIDLLMASVARHVGIDPAPLDPITRLIDIQLNQSRGLDDVA